MLSFLGDLSLVKKCIKVWVSRGLLDGESNPKLVTQRLWVRVSGLAGIAVGGSECPVLSPTSISQLKLYFNITHW